MPKGYASTVLKLVTFYEEMTDKVAGSLAYEVEHVFW